MFRAFLSFITFIVVISYNAKGQIVNVCGDGIAFGGSDLDVSCPYDDSDLDGYVDTLDCAVDADDLGYIGDRNENGHVKTVYPGRAVQDGNLGIKVCQTDGTWSTSTSYPNGYQEEGRTGRHIYISAGLGSDETGDGSFLNPYRTCAPISEQYNRASPPLNSQHQELQNGDTVYLMSGDYNEPVTYQNNSYPSSICYIRGASDIKIMAYPGHYPVINGLKNGVKTDYGIRILQGTNVMIEGLEFKNAKILLTVRENGGLAKIWANKFEGAIEMTDGNNIGAFVADQGTSWDVRGNIAIDIWDSSHNTSENQGVFTRMTGCDNLAYPCRIIGNTISYTSVQDRITQGIKVKHHGQNKPTYEEISKNVVWGGSMGTLRIAAGSQIHHNLLFPQNGYALWFGEVGGSNHPHNIRFTYNTIVGGMGLWWEGDSNLNTENFGNFVGQNNIFDLKYAPSGTNGYVRGCYYCVKAIYDMAEMTLTNNIIYNQEANSTPPHSIRFWAWNNVQGLGVTANTFEEIQGAGWESNSYNEDPQLSQMTFIPTNEHAKGKGIWGDFVQGPPTPPPTNINKKTYIPSRCRCSCRKRRR